LAKTAVRVRAPATSANLGPGFDALGLALTLHDEVDVAITDSGLKITVSGEGAETAEAGERHLVVRAMRAAFAELGGQPPGIELRCVNRIPHGRGLGSSAAAIITGILAARALSASDWDSGQDAGRDKLPDDAVLRLATQLEGHPDNVAACLAGGLTIAWTTPDSPPLGANPGKPGGPHMVRLTPRSGITPVVCIAPEPVSTELARQALPDVIPHADAAANAGRSALLVAALTQDPGTQDPRRPDRGLHTSSAPTPRALASSAPAASVLCDVSGVLFDATEDRLHQQYRAKAMPHTAALVAALRAARIPAVVSGAGPSVLAFLVAPSPQDVPRAAAPPPAAPLSPGDSSPGLDRLDSIVRETGNAWRISLLEVDRQGATVQSVTPGASAV
jgi:homoserine kinase